MGVVEGGPRASSSLGKGTINIVEELVEWGLPLDSLGDSVIVEFKVRELNGSSSGVSVVWMLAMGARSECGGIIPIVVVELNVPKPTSNSLVP